MKRLIILCMIIGILACLSIQAFAAETPLEMPNTRAKTGQTAYLAVTLNETVTANAIGVKCDFDQTILKALPEYSTWEIEGVLSAFKGYNDGAWASQTPQKVTGKLFVLAFQVNEDAVFAYTTVKCTVVLKNSEKEVGNYTVEGSIISDCEHSYGNWESDGKLNHVRICTICGQKNSQMHKWDQGTETTQQDKTLLTKNCVVCKEQSILEISNQTGEIKPVDPTVPAAPGQSAGTAPTLGQPAIPPTNSSSQVTVPAGTTPHNHDHDHAPESYATKPGQTLPNATQGAQEVHDHTHATTPTQSEHTDHAHADENTKSTVLWVFLGFIVLMAAGLYIFIKKNR